MCYSLEASLAALVLGTGVSLYLRRRAGNRRARLPHDDPGRHNLSRDEWLARMILAFTLVQLADAALWTVPPESMPSFATLETRVAASNGKLKNSWSSPVSMWRWSKCTSRNRHVTSIGLPVILTNAVVVQMDSALAHRGWLRRWGLGGTKTRAAQVLWIATAPLRFEKYWGPPPHCTSVCGPSVSRDGAPATLSSLLRPDGCPADADDCDPEAYKPDARLSLCSRDTLVWGNVNTYTPEAMLWIAVGTLGFALPFLLMQPFRRRGLPYFLLASLSSASVYVVNPWAWGSNWCFVAACFSFVAAVMDDGEDHAEPEIASPSRPLPRGAALSARRAAPSWAERSNRNIGLLANLMKLSRYRTGLVLITAVGLLLAQLFTHNTRAPQFVINLALLAKPMKESVLALESTKKDDDTKWLTFWVIYALYMLIESAVLHWVVSAFPFWWAFKIGFLAWLQDSHTNGATTLYSGVLSPFLRSYSVTPNEDRDAREN